MEYNIKCPVCKKEITISCWGYNVEICPHCGIDLFDREKAKKCIHNYRKNYKYINGKCNINYYKDDRKECKHNLFDPCKKLKYIEEK